MTDRPELPLLHGGLFLPRSPAPLLSPSGHAHGPSGHAHGPSGHAQAPESSGARRYEFSSHSFLARKPELERGAGKGRILFLDCASGIAGDMTMAALLDLGLPETVVSEALRAIPGFSARVVARAGCVGAIGAFQVSVEYEGGQSHRPYGEIRELLRSSTLDAPTLELSQRVFCTLAEAEAEVHRVAPEEVEFHEVGSADAIADVVGVAALVSYLGAEVVSSPLPLGRGWVETAHGALPLPAPATLLCLSGVPTYPSGLDAELVTPTGAALVRNLAKTFCEWPLMAPLAVGIGAGHRILPDRPNVLRAVLGAPVGSRVGQTELCLLEANLDDMTAEVLAHVQARLLTAGALDVWVSPVVMKKSRSGVVLSALVQVSKISSATELILTETTTLGVRQSSVTRAELPRRIEELTTRFGVVRYKVSGEPPLRVKPEIEDAIRIADREGLPLTKVLSELDALGRTAFLDQAAF
jgi:pyridinium-3,5-bisthiocarboxylic acid mononucleotide nickel chelatase